MLFFTCNRKPCLLLPSPQKSQFEVSIFRVFPSLCIFSTAELSLHFVEFYAWKKIVLPDMLLGSRKNQEFPKIPNFGYFSTLTNGGHAVQRNAAVRRQQISQFVDNEPPAVCTRMPQWILGRQCENAQALRSDINFQSATREFTGSIFSGLIPFIYLSPYRSSTLRSRYDDK